MVTLGILRLECGGTRLMGGEVKGKLANGVGSQYSQGAYTPTESSRVQFSPVRL